MKMYKGFDKNWKCRDFQYEQGKTYHEDKAKLCDTGFHACENPLDTFRYYSPIDGRFAEVDLDEMTDERSDDTKRCGRKITIGAELSLKGVIEAGVKFIFDKIDWDKAKHINQENQGQAAASGNYGQAAASGWGGQAAVSGDYGQAAASGDYGQAAASGNNSIAVATGINGSAKATLGNFIVVSEWKEQDGKWVRVAVKTARVDGVKIKADTYYKLVGRKFVEVE